MNRFNIIVILSTCLSAASCKNETPTSDATSAVAQDTLQAGNNTVSTPSADIKELGTFVGKLPKEAGVFEKYLPSARMEKLLGVEYPEFAKDWSEETTIKKDGELVYFTGCRKGACADNAYLIIVDLVNNQINVMNFKGRIVRTYEEGGVIIGLTEVLAQEVEKLRSRQE